MSLVGNSSDANVSSADAAGRVVYGRCRSTSRSITSPTIATTGLVALSPQLVRLRPAPHCRTPILSYSLRVEPAEHFINWQQDPQSNYLARLTFPEQVRELRIEVDLVAEMAVYNPFDFFLEPHAETSPFAYERRGSCASCSRSCVTSRATPRFADYLAVDPARRGSARSTSSSS